MLSLKISDTEERVAPFFPLDFHVNSSHDPGTINHSPAFCQYSFPSSLKLPHFTGRDKVYSPIMKQL